MIVATCPWCREQNDLTTGRIYCAVCGHRCDMARFACNCERCLRRTYLSGNYPDEHHTSKSRDTDA